MSYTVTAPLVVVRGTDGADRYFYQGAVLPTSGLDSDHVKMLADDGLIGKESAPAADSEPTKEPTVKEILDEVGDDQARAAAALETEQAKGDKARSSLVEKLQAIANPPV